METTISVTSKWQIHIPKAMRHILGQKKPGQVKIKADKGKLIISPKKGSILDLAGKFHIRPLQPVVHDSRCVVQV